jgi:probable phosphoglycerate mutase
MRILMIRHGDPDYENDTLTSKGIREAKILSDHIQSFNIDEVYQSPLRRARQTAEYSLTKLGMTATTLDWLMEFPAELDPNISPDERRAFTPELKQDPDSGLYKKRIVWDALPSYYAFHPELFDRTGWRDSALVRCSNMITIFDNVEKSFLELLSDYGYEKDGDVFKVKKGNSKTLAFFCHFGITSVLMSILCNISPFVPLQYFAMAPTSVTELVTEEREKGTAIFRILRVGDITHLTMAGEEPSFSARFCERFENDNERH